MRTFVHFGELPGFSGGGGLVLDPPCERFVARRFEGETVCPLQLLARLAQITTRLALEASPCQGPLMIDHKRIKSFEGLSEADFLSVSGEGGYDPPGASRVLNSGSCLIGPRRGARGVPHGNVCSAWLKTFQGCFGGKGHRPVVDASFRGVV